MTRYACVIFIDQSDKNNAKIDNKYTSKKVMILVIRSLGTAPSLFLCHLMTLFGFKSGYIEHKYMIHCLHM